MDKIKALMDAFINLKNDRRLYIYYDVKCVYIKDMECYYDYNFKKVPQFNDIKISKNFEIKGIIYCISNKDKTWVGKQKNFNSLFNSDFKFITKVINILEKEIIKG